MYELEEMIIEEKPLHKKKKRLAKQNSKKDDAASDGGVQQPVDPFEVPLRRITHEYKTYNREKYVRVTVCRRMREHYHLTCSTADNSVHLSDIVSPRFVQKT